MLTKRSVLVAVVLASATAAGSAQSDNYWLVNEVAGRWEYRVGSERPRQLTGPYEALVPQGEVRCLEQDLARCELRYLVNARTSTTARLDVKLGQTGRWVSLGSLKAPRAPVLPATSSELAARFARVTRAGGSRSASGCGGDLPLKAPTCGESIDPGAFTIRWPAVSRPLSILVERTDGEAALFRATAPGQAGEFGGDGLAAFIRSIQSPSDTVDVTVKVLADAGTSAVRLVRIPPAARTDDFAARVRGVGPQNETARTVTRMMLALEEQMWSRAASEAVALLAGGPPSASVQEYALVGLCQSEFHEERAALRKAMSEKRFTELCAGPAPSTTAAAPPPGAPVLPAAPAATSGAVAEVDPEGAPRTRAGIALLIGNSDYWNTPLNSVRNDIKGMSETLTALGFEVTTRENLRSPQQFVTALDEVLKKDAAPDDVLLVYYSGHGVQLDGKSHLLSTGVSETARVAEDLRDNAQSAEDLLARMERAIPGKRILIVEACRDDILSTRSAGTPVSRGGFAFQQDDVPNTFVMFANKPGLPSAVRSDFGLMGPFTEALIYALQNSSGAVTDVYALASKKAAEISPGQQPVMYHSRTIDPIVLAPGARTRQHDRAKELLNSAEPFYQNRQWEEFRATVNRGKALAAGPDLQQRLASEADFAGLVIAAEALEKERKWADAAARWQKAGDLFDRRHWVAMRAAVAWLLADDPAPAVRALAVMAAQADGDLLSQAKQMLAELVQAFPALQPEAEKAARSATKPPAGAEFEKVRDQE